MNSLSGLLDRGELDDICRHFLNLTGLGVSLHNLDGSTVIAYRPDGACICSMMANELMCARNISFSANKAAELGEPYIYICGCGLVMSASAVFLGETLIGAVLCGPAMLWDADEIATDELERNISGTIISDTDCKEIAENTPHFTCKQITGASRILFRLVNYMCRSQNEMTEQRREITKQQATIATLLSDRKQNTTVRRSGIYSPDAEKELLNSVRLGNKAMARKLLNGILTDIFLWSGGNVSIICARVYEMIGFLFRAASEAGAPRDKLLAIARESQKILDPAISFEDLCYTTSLQMENFIDAIYINRQNIPGNHHLIKAISYISENYPDGTSLTLSSVAAELKLSPSYLSHLFSKGLNVTFTDYLAKLRSDAAKELLLNTGLTVVEIAERVGYSDPNYFTRSFKKTVGMTPKAYRRMCKEQG